ncbi:MAG TPA: hypothetical protein VF268_13105 [Gammaproteobacteria bacterium]
MASEKPSHANIALGNYPLRVRNEWLDNPLDLVKTHSFRIQKLREPGGWIVRNMMNYRLFVVLGLSLMSPYVCAGEETRVGFSIGTPAGINFVLKKEIFDIPFQISGFRWGSDINARGIEVGYSFYKNQDSWFRTIQFIAGKSKVRDYFRRDEVREWKYAGLSSTLQFGRFYVEPGITAGSGDYSSPEVSLQMGWLWLL